MRAHYSPLMKTLHWLIAVAVIIMLFFGFFLGDVPDKYASLAYSLHKSTGLTILLLMIIRIVVLHVSQRPPLPQSIKPWEKKLSRFVQYSFYLLLILMPLSGWILSTAANKAPKYLGLIPLPFPGVSPNEALSKVMANSHEILAYIIIAFLFLHIAGALKHFFIDKDNVLQSMWRKKP